MPNPYPMQTGSETVATRNEMPAWYTQYGQAMTGGGLSLLNQNVNNYQGYSEGGAWKPTVAGMSGAEQTAYGLAGPNMGNWKGGMDTAAGTLGSGLNQVGAASNNFNSAGGMITGAGSNFDSAGNYVGNASNNFGAATSGVNSGTQNFNNAQTNYTQSAGGLGQASGQLGQTNNFLNQANPGLVNAGGSLTWAQGNLSPAAGYAQQGGGTLADGANKIALNNWMNPYRENVVNEIQRLGNQNLFENVMPGVNSTFAGAGQFGSTRNGTFLNQAIRDNQATITGAQGQVLLAAQNEANKAYAMEKDRQLEAGKTLGGLSQIGGQLGQGWINQALGFVDAGKANTDLGRAFGENASRFTDLGLAETQTGNARVNQGLAHKGIGDSVVNQGRAMTDIGMGRVSQGNAMTGLGNARVNQGTATGNIGYQQGKLAEARQAASINDVNALLGVGAVDRDIRQRQLDSDLNLWQDWRDHPLKALGALSSIAPQVSSGIRPDTISSTGYTADQPDVYRNLQEIINIINGRS